VIERKKKKAEEARRKHEKEMEIARRVWAGENMSDVESEPESEDPIEVGNDVIFEVEEGREVVTTSAEHHEPMAVSVGGEREVERRGDVPVSRKRAMSSDTIGEQEAKRMRSPRPSEASPSSYPPTVGALGQARPSEEWAHTLLSSGLVPAHDPQWEDTPPATSVGMPLAKGCGDSWVNRELAEWTPLPTEVILFCPFLIFTLA